MTSDETGEPDEFARLLAQLNGTPEPEPQPAAPASTAPPAAAMPAPAMPAAVPLAPAMPAPAAPSIPVAAMPTPAPAQAPVAPAFGSAVPYPSRAGMTPTFGAVPTSAAAAFPTVAADLAETLAPAAPLPPRAPELIGADELAAPPRSFPPLSEPVPPLVGPAAPFAPADPVFAPTVDLPPNPAPAYQPPPAAAQTPIVFAPAPSAPALFAPESAPPAPLGPAGLSSPMTAAPAAAPAAPAPLPSAPQPSAPRDFASLLTTPVGGDDDSRSAAAPLRFGSSAPDDDDDEPDLGRPTAAETVGLVLAILIAPIGLIAGIAAAARSTRRRGWVVGIVRASIAIAAVLTIVWGIAGYYGYTQYKVQQAHDQTAAASAAFCAAIKAEPTMDQLPTFGWPAVAASIPDSLKAMQAYEDRWTKLAKVSPAGIKADVTRVAAAAKKIIDSVTVARTVDDASNVAVMSSIASSSGVPAWYSEYCG